MADYANTYMSANAYWNGSNWIRQTANPVMQYVMENGKHEWITATAAAAGTAASLTQAMTLDNSGNLILGTTTAAGRFTVSRSDSNPAISATGKSSAQASPDIEINRTSSLTGVGQAPSIQLNDGTTTNARLIQAGAGSLQFFGYGGGFWAEQARIDINGALCVGATATNYGTQDIAVFNKAQNDITRVMINNQSNGTSAQSMLELAAYGASWRMYVPSSTNNSNPLIFATTASGTGERARFTGDGKLLVGRSTDDGSAALLQVAGAASVTGHAYVNGAISGYTGYDSGLVVNYGGNGSQFGMVLKPSSSTSDTSAITFLSSGSTYASASRVGAIQHRANDAGMDLAGSWTLNGGYIQGLVPIAKIDLNSSYTMADLPNLFSDTYDKYVIEISNVLPSVASVLAFRVAQGGTIQTGTAYTGIGAQGNTLTVPNTSLSVTTAQAASGTESGSAGITMTIEIMNARSVTNSARPITLRGIYMNTTPTLVANSGTAAYLGGSAALSGFRLYWTNAAVFVKGTIRVYGVLSN